MSVELPPIGASSPVVEPAKVEQVYDRYRMTKLLVEGVTPSEMVGIAYLTQCGTSPSGETIDAPAELARQRIVRIDDIYANAATDQALAAIMVGIVNWLAAKVVEQEAAEQAAREAAEQAALDQQPVEPQPE